MCALIDVAAANIGLEVLIAGVAGAAERPDRVGAGRVSAAEGQGVQRESKQCEYEANCFSNFKFEFLKKLKSLTH